MPSWTGLFVFIELSEFVLMEQRYNFHKIYSLLFHSSNAFLLLGDILRWGGSLVVGQGLTV